MLGSALKYLCVFQCSEKHSCQPLNICSEQFIFILSLHRKKCVQCLVLLSNFFYFFTGKGDKRKFLSEEFF